VCAKGNYVYEVLELTAITRIVPVFETLDEAMVQPTNTKPGQSRCF
jgi:hypothetical protein